MEVRSGDTARPFSPGKPENAEEDEGHPRKLLQQDERP